MSWVRGVFLQHTPHPQFSTLRSKTTPFPARGEGINSHIFTEAHYFCEGVNIYEFGGTEKVTNDSFYIIKVKDLSVQKAGDDVAGLVWLNPEEINLDDFPFISTRNVMEKYIDYRKNLKTLEEKFPTLDKNVLEKLTIMEQSKLTGPDHADKKSVVENVSNMITLIRKAKTAQPSKTNDLMAYQTEIRLAARDKGFRAGTFPSVREH